MPDDFTPAQPLQPGGQLPQGTPIDPNGLPIQPADGQPPPPQQPPQQNQVLGGFMVQPPAAQRTAFYAQPEVADNSPFINYSTVAEDGSDDNDDLPSTSTTFPNPSTPTIQPAITTQTAPIISHGAAHPFYQRTATSPSTNVPAAPSSPTIHPTIASQSTPINSHGAVHPFYQHAATSPSPSVLAAPSSPAAPSHSTIHPSTINQTAHPFYYATLPQKTHTIPTPQPTHTPTISQTVAKTLATAAPHQTFAHQHQFPQYYNPYQHNVQVPMYQLK